MARIIDLDTLVPEDVEVVINGETYLLPGDIPVELMLQVEAATQRLNTVTDNEEGQDVLGGLLDAVTELFRIRQPDLETVPIGLKQCVMLIGQLYSAEEQPVDPPKPAPKRRGGTTSTPRPRKTKTASGS